MKRIHLITKPDGEVYCAATTAELANKIVEVDCREGRLTCDGPLTPAEVNVEEILLHNEMP